MAAIDFPNSPALNDTYTVGTRTWLWNGTFWESVGSVGPTGPTGPAGNFLVSETAPSSPEEGDVWLDSTTSKFYVYYDSFWVQTSSNEAGPSGGFDSTQFVESKSSNYALTSGDAGKLFLNTAAITITVEGIGVGKQVDFIQSASGAITFTAGSGVTLNSRGNKLATASQGSAAIIKCVAANTYWLIGDLA